MNLSKMSVMISWTRGSASLNPCAVRTPDISYGRHGRRNASERLFPPGRDREPTFRLVLPNGIET